MGEEVHNGPGVIRLQAAYQAVSNRWPGHGLVLMLNSQEQDSDEPFVFSVDVQNGPFGSLISSNESGVWAKEKATRPAGGNPTSKVAGRVPESATESKRSVFQYVRNREVSQFGIDPNRHRPSKVWLCNYCRTSRLVPYVGPSLRLLNVYRREGQLRVTSNDW
jgi:hypothetical protein